MLVGIELWSQSAGLKIGVYQDFHATPPWISWLQAMQQPKVLVVEFKELPGSWKGLDGFDWLILDHAELSEVQTKAIVEWMTVGGWVWIIHPEKATWFEEWRTWGRSIPCGQPWHITQIGLGAWVETSEPLPDVPDLWMQTCQQLLQGHARQDTAFQNMITLDLFSPGTWSSLWKQVFVYLCLIHILGYFLVIIVFMGRWKIAVFWTLPKLGTITFGWTVLCCFSIGTLWSMIAPYHHHALVLHILPTSPNYITANVLGRIDIWNAWMSVQDKAQPGELQYQQEPKIFPGGIAISIDQTHITIANRTPFILEDCIYVEQNYFQALGNIPIGGQCQIALPLENQSWMITERLPQFWTGLLGRSFLQQAKKPCILAQIQDTLPYDFWMANQTFINILYCPIE